MKLLHRRQFLSVAGAAALGGAAAWLAAQAPQYGRVRALHLQVLRLQAGVVAYKIDQFIGEIESQIGWTMQFPWSAGAIYQWRLVGSRLLRQGAAGTKISPPHTAGEGGAGAFPPAAAVRT